MRFECDEKDNRYIENVNKDIADGQEISAFVNNVGGEYFINFTCTDVAKANNFILNLLSPSKQDYIEETLGIKVNSLNYCHGDHKIQTLKQYLQSFMEALDRIH